MKCGGALRTLITKSNVGNETECIRSGPDTDRSCGTHSLAPRSSSLPGRFAILPFGYLVRFFLNLILLQFASRLEDSLVCVSRLVLHSSPSIYHLGIGIITVTAAVTTASVKQIPFICFISPFFVVCHRAHCLAPIITLCALTNSNFLAFTFEYFRCLLVCTQFAIALLNSAPDWPPLARIAIESNHAYLAGRVR